MHNLYLVSCWGWKEEVLFFMTKEIWNCLTGREQVAIPSWLPTWKGWWAASWGHRPPCSHCCGAAGRGCRSWVVSGPKDSAPDQSWFSFSNVCLLVCWLRNITGGKKSALHRIREVSPSACLGLGCNGDQESTSCPSQLLCWQWLGPALLAMAMPSSWHLPFRLLSIWL